MSMKFNFSEEPNVDEMTQAELEAYIQDLEDRIAQLDAREPRNMEGEAYEDWADAHEDLEDLLDEAQDRLDEFHI